MRYLRGILVFLVLWQVHASLISLSFQDQFIESINKSTLRLKRQPPRNVTNDYFQSGFRVPWKEPFSFSVPVQLPTSPGEESEHWYVKSDKIVKSGQRFLGHVFFGDERPPMRLGDHQGRPISSTKFGSEGVKFTLGHPHLPRHWIKVPLEGFHSYTLESQTCLYVEMTSFYVQGEGLEKPLVTLPMTELYTLFTQILVLPEGKTCTQVRPRDYIEMGRLYISGIQNIFRNSTGEYLDCADFLISGSFGIFGGFEGWAEVDPKGDYSVYTLHFV